MQDSTWGIRLAVGLVGLVYLAAIDWYKNPKNPTRIKEYGFLFGVTGLAMVHGLVHDFFTHAVSSEYFSVGKGMGPRGDAFGPDVALLALQASWSVGLLIGLPIIPVKNVGS